MLNEHVLRHDRLLNKIIEDTREGNNSGRQPFMDGLHDYRVRYSNSKRH